jgi:putative DNA primase/helicase
MTPQQIARALGGEVNSNGVSAPGPGHSKHDRSLRVIMDPNAPDLFRVHSFAGDDWRTCLDYVRQRLGLSDAPRREYQPKPRQEPEVANSRRKASEYALGIWRESVAIQGTLGETYLETRRIHPATARSHAIRFHPACAFKLEDGTTARLPAMIGLFRDQFSDVPVGIHRTALRADGSGKSDHPGLGNPKRMLGPVKGAAVKISADDEVTHGLHVAEGLETALAAMTLGFSPTWALGSAGAIAAFEPLPGVEAITVLADHDEAGVEAAKTCGRAWRAAGREARILRPTAAKADMNDVLRRLAS